MNTRFPFAVGTFVPMLTVSGLALMFLIGCTGGTTTTTTASTSEPVVLPASVASDWEGKIVVADFWATWCGPCRASSPNVQILHETFAGNAGVLVVAVHADDNVDDPGAYLAEHEYTYPLVEKGGEVADAFGVHALPTFVVLDAEGREVLRHVGMMNERVRKTIQAKVDELRG